MKGENLNKAEQWLDRAITQEEKGNTSMMDKCVNKMIELEKAGLEAGESY